VKITESLTERILDGMLKLNNGSGDGVLVRIEMSHATWCVIRARAGEPWVSPTLPQDLILGTPVLIVPTVPDGEIRLIRSKTISWGGFD